MSVDKSLSFGMQNFFFTKKDTSDGTYDYYGFVDKKGAVLIMRADKLFENALYYITSGTAFSTVFTGRGSYNYQTIDKLKDPTV